MRLSPLPLSYGCPQLTALSPKWHPPPIPAMPVHCLSPLLGTLSSQVFRGSLPLLLQSFVQKLLNYTITLCKTAIPPTQRSFKKSCSNFCHSTYPQRTLEQHCLQELSAMMKMFHICAMSQIVCDECDQVNFTFYLTNLSCHM